MNDTTHPSGGLTATGLQVVLKYALRPEPVGNVFISGDPLPFHAPARVPRSLTPTRPPLTEVGTISKEGEAVQHAPRQKARPVATPMASNQVKMPAPQPKGAAPIPDVTVSIQPILRAALLVASDALQATFSPAINQERVQ